MRSSTNTSKNQIDKAVNWLKLCQFQDGSWKETPALRIPSPHIYNPKSINTWPEDTKGVNVRITEFNRLFTTTIAVAALSKYNALAK